MSEPISLTQIAEIALIYGFIPIPVKGKKPVLPRWQTTTAQTALRKVEHAVEQGLADNIGILTGAPSGVVVVDIDVSRGGLEFWNTLLQEHDLPETFTVKTPSGGRHVYFDYDDRTSILRNATAAIKKAGIDFKTSGGQVVFPGSQNHETGVSYDIIGGYNEDTDEVSIAAMPDWLFQLLQTNQAQLDKKYRR